ncbi:succinate dehydrogenase assembly factor 2 [Thalassorhabdomicrobium marinisediminis]|uniref:succinate dehydrogenase assembly factor 2 n=1 Tax=Thalassorhabdomicrobium marinisediminis TaxID=2170577 RepID=UPI0024935044|nr:succinate dehydrogenase assembly factor 2 [Thalassorhabdomicrobium marinisediminis]
MNEPLDVMRKRLHMRSIRRGIKEMDLILTEFSRQHLATLSQTELELYDALLSESDHDLYQWVSGQANEPARYHALMDLIRLNSVGLTRPAE